MNPKRSEVDVVNDILEECILAYPVSSFIISLYKQYMQRGSLSKKQLQGLYAKASRISDIATGKLATLEAIIKKMPTRHTSELPAPGPLYEKDESLRQNIEAILTKYPHHKRVLFLRSKYDNNEKLSAAEIGELKKFSQLL